MGLWRGCGFHGICEVLGFFAREPAHVCFFASLLGWEPRGMDAGTFKCSSPKRKAWRPYEPGSNAYTSTAWHGCRRNGVVPRADFLRIGLNHNHGSKRLSSHHVADKTRLISSGSAIENGKKKTIDSLPAPRKPHLPTHSPPANSPPSHPQPSHPSIPSRSAPSAYQHAARPPRSRTLPREQQAPR